MYKNDKFPQILGAGRYYNHRHRPSKSDIVRVNFEAAETGAYVIYWWWRGYYDCLDVFIHDEDIDEADVYGKAMGGFNWTKIEHCAYQEPRERPTKCYAVDDVTALAAEMDQSFGFHEDRRYGIQCEPAVIPSNGLQFSEPYMVDML